MKTAVLADLHLTDNFNTVKLSVLDWALHEARLRKCDFLCCIGDLTAQGSETQTAEILKRLNTCSIPYFSTPGNAELRIYPDGRTADRFKSEPPAGVPVILIDTAKDEPAPEELSGSDALPDRVGKPVWLVLRHGGLVNGWHLHQVASGHGTFNNHAPLTGWYDKLISLGGLFMALRAGQLNDAPMFLESRTWEGNRQAFLKLNGLLK